MKNFSAIAILLLSVLCFTAVSFGQENPAFSDLAQSYYDASKQVESSAVELTQATAEVSAKEAELTEAQANLQSAKDSLVSAQERKANASATKAGSLSSLLVVVSEGGRTRATLVSQDTILIAIVDPANPENVRIELIPIE